jgi:hypothetical protein
LIASSVSVSGIYYSKTNVVIVSISRIKQVRKLYTVSLLLGIAIPTLLNKPTALRIISDVITVTLKHKLREP